MRRCKPPAYKKALYLSGIFAIVIFLTGCGNQSEQASERTVEVTPSVIDETIIQDLTSSIKEDVLPEPKTAPIENQPKKLLTPEETWNLFREGYREENLDKVLSACLPEGTKQERCRKQFLGVQEAGGLQEVANSMGEIKNFREYGEFRYYTMPVIDSDNNEAITVSFVLVPDVGWKIYEF